MTPRTLAIALVAVSAAAGTPSRAQSCAGVSPVPGATLTSVTVASGLTKPLFVASPPGDTNRIFIVEQTGRIKIRKRGETTAPITFLDLSTTVDSTGNEKGLLGLAFDPDYATTGRFWVNYTETVASLLYTVVARYNVDNHDPDAADPLSEVRTIRFRQPESNHNGGMLAFGPDGFLYVFTGDGGNAGDPHGTCGNGQNLQAILGKVLRLDVCGVDPAATDPDCGLVGDYKVPSTNPFRDGVSIGSCDEIFAYGLRNPWRSTFDAANGDLYIADVGQGCWEEVDWAAAGSSGQNYGWRVMEGLHCYNPAQTFTCNPTGAACAGSPPCNDPSITRPVIEYAHAGTGACSITGGYVYRGCKLPAWTGAYFYGDWCAGFVRTFRMSGGVATNPVDVTAQVDPGSVLPGQLTSFGVDAQGELYIAAGSGFVKKVVPPFPSLEVSGAGAAVLLKLDKTGDWTWENLYLATDVPVSLYRVYRGTVNGSYACVLKTTAPVWPAGGDPAVPAPDQHFAYVVTAVDGAGQETLRGTAGSFNPATCP